MRARQPGVQWQQAGLGAEAREGQHEHRRANARGNRRQFGEPVGAAGCSQQHQSQQNDDESELGHHRVEHHGRTDRRTKVCSAATKISDAIAISSQASRNVDTDAAAGTSSIAVTKTGSTGSAKATQMRTPGVSDRIHPDRECDCAGQGHEEPAQRIQLQLHTDQRNQPADLHRARRSRAPRPVRARPRLRLMRKSTALRP